MTPQCKTQADCFRELARVMDMVKPSLVSWRECLTHNGFQSMLCNSTTIPDFIDSQNWTFAIAIVEDKPVFVGDTLYQIGYGKVAADGNNVHQASQFHWNPPAPKKPPLPESFIPHDGGECPVDGDTMVRVTIDYSDSSTVLAGCPARTFNWARVKGYKVIKPATVMVELSVEDVAYWNILGEFWGDKIPRDEVYSTKAIAFYEACRKALEERSKKWKR